MIELGKVMEYGSRKYGEHNWSKHADRWAWTQLIASALRHIYAWMSGQNNDKESGLPHLAHALANIAMLLDLTILRKGNDDRNPAYFPEEANVDEARDWVESLRVAGWVEPPVFRDSDPGDANSSSGEDIGEALQNTADFPVQ
jgi:hypothetical protein